MKIQRQLASIFWIVNLMSCHVIESDLAFQAGRTKQVVEVVSASQQEELAYPYHKRYPMIAAHLITDIGVTLPDTPQQPCMSFLILYPLFILNPNIFNYSCNFTYSDEQVLSYGFSYALQHEQYYQPADKPIYHIGLGIGLFLKARLQISDRLFLFLKWRGLMTQREALEQNDAHVIINQGGGTATYSLGLEGRRGMSISLIISDYRNNYYTTPPLPRSEGDWKREYIGLSLGWKFK